jgi:hypothetical protein
MVGSSYSRLSGIRRCDSFDEHHRWYAARKSPLNHVSKCTAAKLVQAFTAFYARYYTGWTPEQFRNEIAKNVYVQCSAKLASTGLISDPYVLTVFS